MTQFHTRLSALALVLFGLAAQPASADSEKNAQTPPSARAASPCPGARDIGPLRASLAAGGVFERYTGENLVAANAGSAITSRTHLDIDLDLAIYFTTTSDSLLFGVALDMINDTFSNSPNFARVTQVFLALKTVYYFQNEIGKGVYAHGDLGPSSFVNEIGTNTGRTTQSTTTSSPLGIGVRVGAGYAFKLSQSVSLFAEANWSFRTAGAATAMPVVLQGGILF